MTAGKAACIGLVLRNDYDPLSQAYTNMSVYPSLQVEVCSWWSSTLTRNGSIGNVSVEGRSYEICQQDMISSDNDTQWHDIVFISNNNSLAVTNLSLCPFLEYVHNKIMNLTGYYATGGYMGYRIYTGKGNFVFASAPQLGNSTPSKTNGSSSNSSNSSNSSSQFQSN